MPHLFVEAASRQLKKAGLQSGIVLATMPVKDYTMEKMEKKHMMDKMLRELEDITNSQTSLLKKITQLEADNINLGNSLLDKRLPDIHEKIDGGLTEVLTVKSEFETVRNKFVEDNKLAEVALAE